MVEVSRTQQDEGLEVATKRGAQVAIWRRHSSHQRMEIFKSPQDWRSPVSFIQPEIQARDSVFCKHSKPWFPSWKEDVGNQNSDCRRDLHETQQSGEATKGVVTINTFKKKKQTHLFQ